MGLELVDKSPKTRGNKNGIGTSEHPMLEVQGNCVLFLRFHVVKGGSIVRCLFATVLERARTVYTQGSQEEDFGCFSLSHTF